ncbi:hypothetical protein B2J93_3745 [Marssonina coronariae]|uniref:Zn(2)-C6 fungal-type domain-containing protein n=1 Tax=Diplocarpon coronariae TaxID=2795749 RepID=A0A218YY09_9HELO|nr:hypothetical protein B2J93_3745 [Marssonina coronariae]
MELSRVRIPLRRRGDFLSLRTPTSHRRRGTIPSRRRNERSPNCAGGVSDAGVTATERDFFFREADVVRTGRATSSAWDGACPAIREQLRLRFDVRWLARLDGVMAEQIASKAVRRGAKSCLECRNRKVRCVWLSGAAQTCQSCMARNTPCELQVYMRPVAQTVASTSRARVARLESEVSELWEVVRGLEARLGDAPSAPRAALPSQSLDSGEPAASPDALAGDEEDPAGDALDNSPDNTPGHLLQLFDNELLGSDRHGPSSSAKGPPSSRHLSSVSSLRALMPTRADMLAIAGQAASWMSLYNAVLPLSSLSRTSEELLAEHHRLQSAKADPIGLATLLLSIALTVQQEPGLTASRSTERMRDAATFVKHVSDCVERTVLSDDALAARLEGIEAGFLFIRLQLGRARVSKTWLCLRRMTSLAELTGLPRAAMTATMGPGQTSPLTSPLSRQKAEVWRSICAVDRIQSLMWSLPLATAKYAFPTQPILDAQGRVNPQSYLYSLADIASRVLELDNLYTSGRPLPEISHAVTVADQELRTLSNATPREWHNMPGAEFHVDLLLQHWHSYLEIRTHLQLALKYDQGQEFAFNFITCLGACQELARRYMTMRALVPDGFFANRVIDMQAFTATMFLLLAAHRTHGSASRVSSVDGSAGASLVAQVIEMMRRAAVLPGGDFARQAADALCSLGSLLQQPQTSQPQRITLDLALIGRIQVSRKPGLTLATPTPSHSVPNSIQQGLGGSQAPDHGNDPAFPGASGSDLTNPLSYSIESLDNYLFFAEETPFPEQWLTWTGWNAVS